MPRKIIHLFLLFLILSTSQLIHAQWDSGSPDYLPPGMDVGGGGNITIDPPFDGGWDGGDEPWNPGSGGGDPWLPPEDVDDPEWGGDPGDGGGGGGPGDDDDCSYCDGYDDEHEMESDNKSIMGKVAFKVSGSAMVDFDGYTYIINLSENTNIGKVEPGKNPISEKGFKVIKMRRGGLSLNVSGSTYLSGMSAISANIGLNVSGGLAWVAERHVKEYSQIKKLPFFMPMVPTIICTSLALPFV